MRFRDLGHYLEDDVARAAVEIPRDRLMSALGRALSSVSGRRLGSA